MKLRALIIDDERPSRDNLKAILVDYFEDIHIIGQAGSVDEALTLLNELNPDLIFLDVQLGPRTGLELLTLFPEPEFETVFITAYDEYAVKAFRTNATDYLLKPIDIDDLREAILKVKSKIKAKREKEVKDQTDAAHNVALGTANFIKINTQDGTEYIAYQDILYLQSINYYTNIVLNDGREIITTKILKDYENMLKEYNFFRVHNSYIINLKYLKGVVAKETYFAKLTNDVQITISRRRKDDFIKFIENNKDKNTEF